MSDHWKCIQSRDETLGFKSDFSLDAHWLIRMFCLYLERMDARGKEILFTSHVKTNILEILMRKPG